MGRESGHLEVRVASPNSEHMASATSYTHNTLGNIAL